MNYRHKILPHLQIYNQFFSPLLVLLHSCIFIPINSIGYLKLYLMPKGNLPHSTSDNLTFAKFHTEEQKHILFIFGEKKIVIVDSTSCSCVTKWKGCSSSSYMSFAQECAMQQLLQLGQKRSTLFGIPRLSQLVSIVVRNRSLKRLINQEPTLSLSHCDDYHQSN